MRHGSKYCVSASLTDQRADRQGIKSSPVRKLFSIQTPAEKDYLCYYLLAGALFLFLIGQHFLSKGMFFDGVIYAGIGHNMAGGVGSFWAPVYNAPFFSHPPLVFGIESCVFKIFGDSYLVEKIYSVATYILSAWLIVLLWHKFGFSKRSGWLPLVCWIIMPEISWAAPYNLIENTMTVFILACAFCYLKSTEKNMVLWSIYSSFLWLCTVLCKGPTALFIVVLPVLYRLFLPTLSWKKLLVDEVLFVGELCLWVGLLLLVQPQCRHYFDIYWHTQIVGSLGDTKQVLTFGILLTWVEQIIIPCVIICLLAFRQHHKKRQLLFLSQQYRGRRRLFLCNVLVGLCGVLPIIISPKQSGFYILPALPFFALALGILVESILQPAKWALSSHRSRVLWKVTVLFCCGAVLYSLFWCGRFGRDRAKLSDIERTFQYLPNDIAIGMSPALREEWDIYANYVRFKGIRPWVKDCLERRFYLSDSPQLPSAAYTLLTPQNTKLFLFEQSCDSPPDR